MLWSYLTGQPELLVQLFCCQALLLGDGRLVGRAGEDTDQAESAGADTTATGAYLHSGPLQGVEERRAGGEGDTPVIMLTMDMQHRHQHTSPSVYNVE